MIGYQLVPTLKMIERARSQNENVYEYMYGLKLRFDNNLHEGDKRRVESSGEVIEDIAISYEDGTRIQIHPTISDVKDLDKVELYLYLPNQRYGEKITAYADLNGLDFGKIQTNQSYLEVLGKLISPTKLNKKMGISRVHGLNELYIGSIVWNDYEKKYKKQKRFQSDDEALKHIMRIKTDNEINRRRKEMNKNEGKEKEKCIAEIEKLLQGMTLQELIDLQRQLEKNRGTEFSEQ